jgi:hypothetical protein
MRMATRLMVTAVAFAVAPAAHAATILPGNPTSVPNAYFDVSGDIASGPISASFGRTGLESGNFTDTFLFRIDQNGLGSGSITTILSGLPMSATDLDFTSVIFNNGVTDFVVDTTTGAVEQGGLANIPITFGTQNSLTVNYLSRGQGSYGGTLTFTPSAIPEPATWGMLLLGFGAMGTVVRRRKQKTRVAYAF